MLKNLPIGAKVKDTLTTYNGKPIIFTVMEHNHAGDPDNSTALITEKIITLKCFDAIEAGNSDSNRKQYGNNRYLYSNLKQWLNSDKAAGAWYSAQHSADASPTNVNVWSNYNEYDQEKGFLANFSTQLKEQLLTVTKRTAKNTVTDGGGYEDISGKVFLLSNTEVGLSNENGVAEGSLYSLFSTASNRQCKPTAEAVSKSEYTNSSLNANSNWYWWLRTPYASHSYLARIVNTDGSLNYNYAYRGNYGVRPACVVSSSILVSDTVDADGAYVIEFNSPPHKPEILVKDGERIGEEAYIEFRPSTDEDGDVQFFKVQVSSDESFDTSREFGEMEKLVDDAWTESESATNEDAGKRMRIRVTGKDTRYVRVVATDSGSGKEVYSDIKRVSVGTKLGVLTDPVERNFMPAKIAVAVEGQLDANAEMKIYVTNNAKDAEPAWEEYAKGSVHSFANRKKETKWATSIKVEIEARDATGEISISEIISQVE